jgi:hypothetical protein
VRFEVPSRYRTLTRCAVRVARWDLSSVDLVDPRTGAHLATLLPLDTEERGQPTTSHPLCIRPTRAPRRRHCAAAARTDE